MKLKLVTAVKDAENDATCAVFEHEDSAVIVARALGRDAPEDLRSIKLRDLGVEQLELYARSCLLSTTGIEL